MLRMSAVEVWILSGIPFFGRPLWKRGKTSDGAIASVLEDVPIMAMVGCCCKLPLTGPENQAFI